MAAILSVLISFDVRVFVPCVLVWIFRLIFSFVLSLLNPSAAAVGSSSAVYRTMFSSTSVPLVCSFPLFHPSDTRYEIEATVLICPLVEHDA